MDLLRARETADEELMVQIAAGRAGAFEALVRRHEERVLRIALRFAPQADAEDIGQDVFLSVFRAASRYTPRAQFTTWLYRIVVNACLSHRRRMQPVPAPRPEPSDTADRVREAVGQLPERQRLAVILHRFDGLPHREIAAALDTTESAIESLLARAYAALRNLLKI